MKVIFMGTPDFASGVLEAVIDAGHEVLAVVTQPDKEKGRGREKAMPPVKQKAMEYGIDIYQPVKVRTPEFVKILKDYNPEAIIVVAFGQILSKEILSLPEYGCINVHASLLPEYRGAAPIQWAVIDGKKESGVSIMKMDEGIDTGDIIRTGKLVLSPDETGGSLFDKLEKLGAKVLIEALTELEEGRAVFTPQTGKSSYAGKIDKAAGRIDFNRNAVEIERLIRGLNPWPSAYTVYKDKILKIWKAEVVDTEEAVPGTITEVTEDSFTVAAKTGGLKILELQLEGRKKMDTGSFLRGNTVEKGFRL